jgi:tRNA(fMet)-specific endonuclease VapC
MRICLDTSAYTRFKDGHPPVVGRVDSAAWVGVPAIVAGELEIGFRLGRYAERNLEELDEFLGRPLVKQVIVDRDVARLYAEIAVELRRNGTPIPTNDVWIAACSAREGATVVTYDRHFEAIDRVAVLVLEAAGGAAR